jgi:hypothetical protein
MPVKKRKSPKKQRGAGKLQDALKFIKDNHVISKGLSLIPNPVAQVASQVTSMAGLGKKRKRKSKSQSGRGIFSDLGGGIGSVFGGLGSGIGSVAKGLFGGGRRKKAGKGLIKI